MKRKSLLFGFVTVLFAIHALTGYSQNAWINEIHYDNTGTDANEMVEVIIENAGSYALADFSVILYNGSGGGTYLTTALNTFTAGTVEGDFSFFYFVYPSNGIQNGAPDGVALVYQGAVVTGQFLSYEGVLTATNGPAAGLISNSIGVQEVGTEALGLSLQLSGAGASYGDYTWQGPATATPGQLNNGQSFTGPLPEPSDYPEAFTALADNITITLTWTDASGTQLPSGYLVKISNLDNIGLPVDGVPITNDLDLSDGAGSFNVAYGAETCLFNHLSSATEYFFKIFPYTNAGGLIDYKTNESIPSASATTEAVIFGENFESDTFGGWTAFSAASDKNWDVVNFGGALSTTYFAQVNGFGEDVPSNDWLISPAINLVYYSNEKVIFYTQWRFGSTDTELKLLYSTDYAGGDPTLATWIELPFVKSLTQDIWTFSGNISLDEISAPNFHLAFQYLSSGTPRRWGVDQIIVLGEENPSVPVANWAIGLGALLMLAFTFFMIKKRF